jgi:hypothetical protein
VLVVNPLLSSLLILLAYVPLISAVHEGGHVIGGRIGGYYVAASGFGGGRRFWRLPLGRGFNLFLGPELWAGGATVAFPTHIPMDRFGAFTYHYGGIAAQLLLQLSLHAVYVTWPETRLFVLPGILFNALVIGANVVPYRLPVGSQILASDGSRVLAALGASRNQLLPQAGLGAETFDPISSRVRSEIGSFVLNICRAKAIDDRVTWDFLGTAQVPAGCPQLYVEEFERLRDRWAEDETTAGDPTVDENTLDEATFDEPSRS